MRKIKLLFATFAIISIVQCSKKDDPAVSNTTSCTSCKNTPDALAVNDASTKGIYKGVIAGSSGTIAFDIANSSSAITGVMMLDGVKVNLTTSKAWVANQPYDANFVGTLNGSAVAIELYVSDDGSGPYIFTQTIPGHNLASIIIAKETSTNQLKAYEGTFAGPDPGVWNFITNGVICYVAAANKSGQGSTLRGTISNGLLTLVNATGAINGDKASGTVNLATTVTWSAMRTM